MKKATAILLSLWILCVVSSPALAGSIDVDLVADDEALVFIGSVDEFSITNKEKDYPYTEYTANITPSQKIKGDVTVGKTMNFENFGVYKTELQKDCKYLFGYMQDKLYVWELASYNDLLDWELADYTEESIILKERHNDTISGGIQYQLNEGVFDRAEKERQNAVNTAASDSESNASATHNTVIAIVKIILGLVAIVLFAIAYKRMRKNKE